LGGCGVGSIHRNMRRLIVVLVVLAGLCGGIAATVAPSASLIIQNEAFQHDRGTTATWSSSNWSGYAETGAYSAVQASWTVASVSPGIATQFGRSTGWFSATWVGIDGYNNSSLIQTGTEQDYYGGTAHYTAWWEILPAAETVISEPVSPGDSITATITKGATAGAIAQTNASAGAVASGRVSARGLQARARRTHPTTTTVAPTTTTVAPTTTTVAPTTTTVAPTTTTVAPTTTTAPSNNDWTITIADTSAGWSFTTVQSYTGPATSAEWVVEAPSVNGRIATLADYGFPNGSASTGDFNSAEVASGTGALQGAGLSYKSDSGVMIQSGAQVSTPGPPDTPATAFNARYGSVVPAAPTT
jgi:hypothetical protein